jgi:hypothetical protein
MCSKCFCPDEDYLPDLVPCQKERIDMEASKTNFRQVVKARLKKTLSVEYKATGIHTLHGCAHTIFNFVNAHCLCGLLPKMDLYWMGVDKEWGVLLESHSIRQLDCVTILLNSNITKKVTLLNVLIHEIAHAAAILSGSVGGHGNHFRTQVRIIMSRLKCVMNNLAKKINLTDEYNVTVQVKDIMKAKGSFKEDQ